MKTTIKLESVALQILVDNRASGALKAEHGFSVWITIHGWNVLFDTGQNGRTLLANAKALRVDLSTSDMLLLSHGHYDHTGGVKQVLARKPDLLVMLHDGADAVRFSIHEGAEPKDISMPPPVRTALAALPEQQVRRIREPQRILAAAGLSGAIPRTHPLEDTGGPFFLDTNKTVPDLIPDDLALWIKTDRGLLIITGCCHAGLINTVDHLQRVSGIKKIYGIIGGLHLHSASEQRLTETINALHGWKPELIVPCHCTGDAAIARMKAELGDCVVPGHAGWKRP